MPADRCKYFWSSGKPFGVGCQVPNCPYVHPEDKDSWASLPPYKSNTRCKSFNSQGKSVGTCIDGSKYCRFIHPEEPAWKFADPPHTVHLPPPSYPRLASKTQGNESPSSVSNPRHAELSTAASKPNVRSVHTSLPRLQTDMSKYSDTSTSATVTDSRLLLRRITGTTPVRISTPDFTNSPLASSSTVSQTGGLKRQAWKNLILSLTQASNIRREIEETDKRTSLFSVDNATALTPLDEPQLDELLNASRDKIKGLEGKLNVIISQLTGAEFWPFSNAFEMMARLEQSTPSDPHERLARQLDEFEAQLKEHVKIYASTEQVIETSGMVLDNAIMDERLQNWRTPLDGSVVQTPIVAGITDRLDALERKIFELEEREMWRYDQLVEKVEEIHERILRAGVSFSAHVNEHQNQVVPSISAESPKDFTGARLQHLNNEFMGLCEALAEHLPVVATLEADLGKIRLDSTNARQSMNSLESSYAKLREQLDSVSCQTLDISSQILNPRTNPQPGVSEGRDYLITSVLQDVKQHVATAGTDLDTSIASRYKDAQNDIFMNFGSTMVKTDAIYDIMKRRSTEKQLRKDIRD